MASAQKVVLKASIKKSTPPFDVLTPKQFALLKDNYLVETYSKNSIIYREGDPTDGIRMLASGKVKIFKEGIGGKEQIVKLAKANEFIGYRAVMAKENHTASAVALEDCQIFLIPQNIVYTLLDKNCKLCRFVIEALATELSFSRVRSVSLAQKQIRGRLAESLLVLRDKYGVAEGNVLNVSLTREDIANLSNMTTSNAIRTLANFVSENIISLNGREIGLLNEPALEKISRMG